MNRKLLFIIGIGLLAVPFALSNSNNIVKTNAANLGDDPLWCDGYDIKPLEQGEFTIAAYGDTQKAIEYHPETVMESYQWIVDNKTSKNIKYVISCGDIVDDVDLELDPNAKPEEQCQNAKDCFNLLKSNNVDFSLLLGNHDYEDMAFNKRQMDMFEKYFPVTFYEGVAGFQGSMDGSVENTYHYFENGNDKYLIVTLGHHPTDEIIEWADEIVSQNPDRKTIIVTHSYIDGGGYSQAKDNKPYYDFYAGGYGGRNEDGEHVWEGLVSKHENIFMVFCGHELTQEAKRIGHSVAYGNKGNTIHQFILNPADIDLPYGGAGLVGLFTFRNDGTVDTRFYCPTLDKYFNPDSQYTFDLISKIENPSKEVEIVGHSSNEDIIDDFSSYSIGSKDFKNKSYSCNGLEITNNGLTPISDDASITYKFHAKDYQRIKKIFPTFVYSAKDRNCGILVSVSEDGENYIPFYSVDGTSTGVVKLTGGTYQAKFDLKNYVKELKEAYIRISFLKGSAGNISISSLEIKQKMATVTYDEKGKFGIDLDFSQCKDFEVESWAKDAVYQDFLTCYSGSLGTGKKNDIAGSIGTAIWRFDAPANGKIQTMSFNAKGLLALGNYDFDYCLKISLSINNGLFEDFVEEDKSSKTSFSYDFTNKIKGASTVSVKLCLHGAYWNDVCLKSLKIEGTYSYGINYHVGEGIADPSNPSEYGVSSKAIALKDPIAPKHYIFAGWYDNDKYEGDPIYSIPAGTYGSLDLYAKYVAITHNIIYNLNGGKNSSYNPKTFSEVEDTALYDATRNGYTFMGWYDNENFSGNPILSIPEGTTDDVTLYAKFLKTYRISYVLSGGTIAEEDKITYFTEESEFVLPTPTKNGYNFKGWYLEKTYENAIEKISQGTTSNLIVYAKWEKIKGSSTGGCGGSIATVSVFITLSSILGIILVKKRG